MSLGKRTDGGRRISMGSFTLHGSTEQARLTISSDLDAYDFPNEVGDEVRVELVDEPGEEPYLEVHPIGGD